MTKDAALKQAINLLVEISVVNRSHTIAINKTLMAIRKALEIPDALVPTREEHLTIGKCLWGLFPKYKTYK